MLKRSPMTLLVCTLFAGCSQVSTIPDQPDPDPTLANPVKLTPTKLRPHYTESTEDTRPQAEGYTDLWSRLRDGYQFSEIDDSRIEKQVNQYLTYPKYIEKVAERGNEYLYHIINELEARDMPLELALLPIVESSFDPFANSPSNASGMWQFIPSTGSHLGLKQNWWYDGRRDVLASTDAALTYLSQLYKQFDEDWLLALAAYNAGGGSVSRAIQANKQKGKPTDFWSLDLPEQTRAYVPRLLAISKIILEAEQYKIRLPQIDNEPYFETVDTGTQIDLAQAASLAGLDLDELHRLNAGFNRWATDPQGPHRLLIPVDKAESFRQALGDLPEDSRVAWEHYKVKSGDTLLALAKRFNTSVDIIRDQNKLNGHMLRVGQTLLIPSTGAPATLLARAEPPSRSESKAQPDKVQPDKVQPLNARANNNGRQTTYTVKSGDTLWSIAKRHQVSVADLTKWNNLSSKGTLKANQKLVVWNKADTAGAQLAAQAKAAATGRKVDYQVRNGDSLARIAGKFKLSVDDILRWNPLDSPHALKPGQSLTLFVDASAIN